MQRWLHVLRIRCEHLEQPGLFAEERLPHDVISDAFLSMPEGEIGGGSEWHIAAAERFAGNAIFFQIGRVQTVKSPQYDGTSRTFYEAERERAPFTIGVFDAETQACVIERRASVSAKAVEIAPKLEKLLNTPSIANDAGFRIVVDELRDPEGFIEQIIAAHRITRFSFSAEFENAHDVGALIRRPAERYNELIGGTKTTVETRGEDLDKVVVEEAARSAASVGDPASATIREEEGGKAKTIHLRGSPLLEPVTFGETVDAVSEAMLAALRAAYFRIRRPSDD